MAILLQIVQKKFCNYCKKLGHIIKECFIRLPRRQPTAFQANVVPSSAGQDENVATPEPTSAHIPAPATLTPEMVQQMIISAFFALGIQGKSLSQTKSWLLDSAASNHMTSSNSFLKNVRPYHGSDHIQVANGNIIPISAVGDITPTFNNILVSPGLSHNLLSVGQLVDNHYDVHFSRDGCYVQDHVSGTVIAKGPKVGRLFPLHIPSHVALSSSVANKSEVWHKHLGHPNSANLSHLFTFGLLGQSDQTSLSRPSFDCSTCKLGKSKILPFSNLG